MAFQIGNITKTSKPHASDLISGICMSCYGEADEVACDAGFFDSFGWVEDYEGGSSCCGSGCQVREGKIFLDKVSFHIARKDHMRGDKVIVKSGERYRYHIIKGYYVDEDGTRKGIFEITKKVVK